MSTKRSKAIEKPKNKKKQSEDKIITGIKARTIEILKTFLTKKNKIITGKIIFIATNIWNMKVMVTEIKPYQSNNTSMRLNHT